MQTTPAPGSLAALLANPTDPAAPVLGGVTIRSTAADLAAFPGAFGSQSDLLTLQPGGLQRYTVGVPGVAGGAYTVDASTVGSGPVVPLNQRVPGERYDANGRVIF